MSVEERLSRLRLIRSQNVGPATFHALMAHFHSAIEALEAAPDLARRGGRGRAIRLARRDDAEQEIESLDRLGGHLIVWGETHYPVALADIPDPPPVLQVLGDMNLAQQNCIGMVGARNASAAGRQFAREISANLGQNGFVIVSGMARGIDTAAHEGALATGTLAVVAGGVDVVYPPENQGLYEDMVAQGTVLSEQPLGTRPTARHFPPRNRLISGLSLGVLVVEAAPRSGSLITARMALEQGRTVFAVPGSPMDPRYRGTNGLIRDGAVLTETGTDILDHLGAVTNFNTQKFVEPSPEPETIDIAGEKDALEGQNVILNLLSPVPVSVDELLRRCQLSPAVVITVLLELELAGRLERHPGNRVSLLT
ncbi:MAG: DNA-protecting protein DprA [Rhodospirillaceae bacterium]|nr:DNA-protecting protein DprA [Rhodospirillaceae bacterium]MBT5456888.1 DNA-protecting protein DprA [Rhodospirillaceae bacterium]